MYYFTEQVLKSLSFDPPIFVKVLVVCKENYAMKKYRFAKTFADSVFSAANAFGEIIPLSRFSPPPLAQKSVINLSTNW